MVDADAVKTADFWSILERRMLAEWLFVTSLMLGLTILLSVFSTQMGIDRIDNTFYDSVLSITHRPQPSQDIVIIAIDDDSIDSLGYWPWRRALHARLLNNLSQARVIGLDVLLNDRNPAYPDDDGQLAAAMQANGKVVLPTMITNDNPHIIAPLPALARASAGLGYINIHPDSDGVVRTLVLRKSLANGEVASHFLLAMLNVAGLPAGSAASDSPGRALLIPYYGGPNAYTVYPYAKVINGEIPSSQFRNKLVLVGAWGSGLGDAFHTPVSLNGRPMAGVEILANGLQSLIHSAWIRTPPPWLTALLACLPVLLACVAFRRLSPRLSFVAASSTIVVVFIGCMLLMAYAGVWIPITASLIGVAIAFPLWSWRSQEASLQHIDHELTTLEQERAALGEVTSISKPTLRDGSLSARVRQLHDAVAQLRIARSNREETLRFLSHDMRSPQSAILALAQLQKQPETALPQEEMLSRVESLANKTLHLVDGFVSLARAEAMQMRIEHIDLVELLAHACDELWASARKHHIDIVTHQLPAHAWSSGDTALWQRAFCNVMDNAVKYSPENSRIVCTISPGDSIWRVSIRDQGRGISAKQIAHLFEPFARFDESRHGNPAGLGLGLAFVRTVAERHGGRVLVHSTEGQGSEFILELPAVPL